MTLYRAIFEYINHLGNRYYSIHTLKRYNRELQSFKKYIEKHDRTLELHDITSSHIERYIHFIKDKSPSTKKGILVNLKSFFTFFYLQDTILIHPMDTIDCTIIQTYKRPIILSKEEITLLMSQYQGHSVYELRNQTVLETLYGTGIRNGELIKLELNHINLSQNHLFIHQGKGYKDRIVPIPDYLKMILTNYIQNARPYFTQFNLKSPLLFLTNKSNPFNLDTISTILKQALKRANIKKNITPHSLRHSFATHLIENGIDLHYLQKILGHNDIQTTLIYSHPSIHTLQKQISLYHPHENEMQLPSLD